MALALAAFLVVLRLAVRGALPGWLAGLLLAATLILGAARALGPGFARRPAFAIVAVAAVLGLPTLGTSGLIDPWETHYAEVARAMIERRDAISPWWSNEGWFRSKPVLTFWLEALALLVSGARTGPDEVLLGHPEWAIRLPHFALALAGTLLLHDGVARTVGRRPALLGALVLWTMPGFVLLSHQALTDMPLVAGVAASLGLALRALATPDHVPSTARQRLGLAVTVGVLTLGQCAFLLLHGFGRDHVFAGDPHACGLPSQPACAEIALALPRLTPALQATLWLGPALWLVDRAWREPRAARLAALAAWGFAALATMAKGPAGLVLPAAAILVHLAARRSARELLRLEIPAGLVLVIALVGPWYLAAYARHGRPFLDELVVRNMLDRTLGHLHDTNEGDDTGIGYFVRQLAYATFPWSGIALVSVLGAARGGRDRRARLRAVLFGAVLVGFGLVSVMQTKFHHYGLVVLPAVAMLTGLALAEHLEGDRRNGPAAGLAFGLAALVTALVGRDIAATPARFILLLSYRYSRAWPQTHGFATAFALAAILATCGFLLAALRYRRAALGGVLVLALALSGLLLGRYLPRCAEDGGQRALLATFQAERTGTAPLVAYQLNWKGESFYTGNRLAIFLTGGASFRDYLAQRRASQEERTVFVVTERPRLERLRREVGPVARFEERAATPEFSLVRIEL